MANRFNPQAWDDIWLDYWTAGDVNVVAIDDTYVYDDAHTFLSDIDAGARIGIETIPTPTNNDGVFDLADMVIPSGAGSEFRGYWFYKDSGSEATSRLILFVDHNADGTSVSGTTTVDGISLPISPAGLFTISTVPL